MSRTSRFADRVVERRAAPVFEITGGALCLDFANTLDTHKSENGGPVRREVELTRDYSDLLAWGVQAGALSEDQAKISEALGKRAPRAAGAVVRRARDLREEIYRVFSAAAKGRRQEAAAPGRLSEMLVALLQRSVLARSGPGYQWEFAGKPGALDSVLWAVAQSAATLLTSGALGKVRECNAETCSWLFLDKSKNGTRRWCDMKVCGNRAKVRRFRKKHT